MSFQEMFSPNYKISLPKFNPYEERIIKILSIAKRKITTRQIASYSKISYNTVKKNLSHLEKNNLIKKKELGNRIYWSI